MRVKSEQVYMYIVHLTKLNSYIDLPTNSYLYTSFLYTIQKCSPIHRQWKIKIDGQVVEIGINKVSLNIACLYENVNINFDYLLNNIYTGCFIISEKCLRNGFNSNKNNLKMFISTYVLILIYEIWRASCQIISYLLRRCSK